MASRSRYLFQTHQKLDIEDLPGLPVQLRKLFQSAFKPILMVDPYHCGGFPSHALTGDLPKHRALEINWAGTAYRLVYRIYEKPAPRRVLVLSFDEHDSAYEKARARAGKKQ